MYKEQNFHNHAKNPSFSSTLLDTIYRSIDEGETKTSDIKFYTETTINKHIKTNAKFNTTTLKEQQLPNIPQINTKPQHEDEHDKDVVFFSSTSSSSDSSSGLLSSSSDTESFYRAKSRGSCFAPSRPKPVKTTVPTERRNIAKEDNFIKSKSRALKIYNNLKKVKQPISPGGKLTSFLNSLFVNNEKKTKKVSSFENVDAERKTKSGQASSCSSVSSFSRSCLSRNNSSTSRKKSHNGVKRTVEFYPVNVIVDEENQPCGHKCLYGGKDLNLTALSVPTAWKIGRTITKKSEKEEFSREYHQINHKILREFSMRKNDDDDDVASCCSSDLFELDHLDVMGRYCEDLPVFETTDVSVSTNRAIRIM